MPQTPQLLHIHPNGHLNDLVVPAGVFTNLNSVTVPKLGRYAFEVTDEEIQGAGIITVDLHWALAISGFEWLIAHIRRLNPAAPVIVGGVSAGHYAHDLLERFPIDYVLRGDSEWSFAQLVEALVAGHRPDGLPNVFGRGLPMPAQRRMTQAEFDATDPLSADWFPTYNRVSNWNAVAFPQGRTVPVSRGCAFSCPECYGSYASTYGPGYLLRTPEGLARLMRRASDMGFENVRLFMAKPPPKRLTALLHGLAEQGPFGFTSTVGIYLCTPPSEEDLRLLERAFDGEVTISMIPPEEHVPAVPPRRLAIEESGWQAMAERVRGSSHLNLDAWTTARGNFGRTQAKLGTEPAHPRVKVSFGAVWSVTRPTDNGDKPSFEALRAAVLPLWTFYAARLLSPALAELLTPFRFLDELDGDPDNLLSPGGVRRGYFERIMDNWRQHHLPMLPGLGFSAVAIHLRRDHSTFQRVCGVQLGGAFRYVRGSSFEVDPALPAVPLVFAPDHRGVRLQAQFAVPPEGALLALVPQPLPTGACNADWVHAIGAQGLVAMRIDPTRRLPLGEKEGPWTLHVNLRVQDARGYVHRNGVSIAEGRADLGYFRTNGPTTPSAHARKD